MDLIDLSSSSFLCVCICMHVCVLQVPAQVMYIIIFRLLRSSSEKALNNVLLCNVTNWAEPVREENIGNNGV